MDESSSTWIYVLGFMILLLLVVLNAFFAAAEIAVVSVRRSRIRQLALEGHSSAEIVERLLEHPDEFISNVSIAITIITIIASTFATALITHLLNQIFGVLAINLAAGIATGVMVFILLIFGEITPKSFAMRHAERIALLSARPVLFVHYVLFPFVWLVSGISNAFIGLFGGKNLKTGSAVTGEEIEILVKEGAEEGEIEEEKKEMIHGIFDLSEKCASEVMVPRIDIVGVEANTGLGEVLGVIVDSGHSRIPVYEETIDNIIGVVYAKDLLPHLNGGKMEKKVKEVMREAYYVPETKQVDELFREFKQKRMHMAIVLDEYGGTAGLVTIEDLLEEIVGEIEDEYDKGERWIEKLEEGIYLVDARAGIDDVKDALSMELPGGDFDTIGGFVFEYLGRLPEPDEHIDLEGWEIIVKEVEERRIVKLKLEKKD